MRWGSTPRRSHFYLEARDIEKKALGRQHPEYATSLNNLAVLYDSMGEYSKAEPLYLEARDIRKRALGPQHPDYGTSLNNLAVLYESMGKYAKAERLYLEARDIRKRSPRPPAPRLCHKPQQPGRALQEDGGVRQGGTVCTASDRGQT